jgi:hypothetical protein
MRVLSSNNGVLNVELTDDDLVALANALNEVLHGPDAIEELEFTTRMGVTRAEAEALLNSFPGGGGSDYFSGLR